MSKLTLLLIGLSVSLATLGQILLKAGVGTEGTRQAIAQSRPLDFVYAVSISPFVWLGLTAFGVSVVLWLAVLTRVELSTAYPFVALGLVATTLLGHLIYGETMTGTKLLAILMIAVGAIVLTRSSPL